MNKIDQFFSADVAFEPSALEDLVVQDQALTRVATFLQFANECKEEQEDVKSSPLVKWAAHTLAPQSVRTALDNLFI